MSDSTLIDLTFVFCRLQELAQQNEKLRAELAEKNKPVPSVTRADQTTVSRIFFSIDRLIEYSLNLN